MENLYKIREEDALYLYCHPQPNLMLMEVISSKQTSGPRSSLDKKGGTLDIFVRKIYSSGMGKFKVIMARYDIHLWDKTVSHKQFLPDDKKEAAKHSGGGLQFG